MTPLGRRLMASCDRAYRSFHGLDSSTSEVGSVVRVGVRRSYRRLRLPDGTTVRRGDRIGVLHLNNDRVAALHVDGLQPIAVGLEFRRQLLASVVALARLASPGGWLSDVQAFEATTIFFHQWFRRVGFEADGDGPAWSVLVGAYQRALLAALRPASPVRRSGRQRQARRLWISREKLLMHYGPSSARR